MALTMMDIAKKNNIQIDIPGLERELGILVVPVNPRKNKGISQLKKAIEQTAENIHSIPERDFINTMIPCTAGYQKECNKCFRK